MMQPEKKLHENQHLGRRRIKACRAVQGFPQRSPQSIDAADVADAAQLPRLSSARANNSASFGSLPALRSISRFRIQPIAARRTGNASPWHDQPEIRRPPPGCPKIR
jgi:hypothetical protein